MKSILEIYSTLWDAAKRDDRFIRETFVDGVYKDILPQLTVVDLGGFTGEFSFYCLPFAKKVFTVEPDPVPFEQLKKYVELFGLEDKMKIFNFAIAATDGVKRMNLMGGGGSHYDESGTEVKAYSLQTFMGQNKIDYIDILKVDIEGGEEEIFAAEDFPSSKIGVIIGEHNGFSKLKKHGFKVESKENGIFLATK